VQTPTPSEDHGPGGPSDGGAPRSRRRRGRRRGGRRRKRGAATPPEEALAEAPPEGERDEREPAPPEDEAPRTSGRRPRIPLDATAIPVEECAFAEYHLHPELLEGIAACGFRTPSPIQARVLPYGLDGRDIVGQAKTGTGKTGAYLIPALQRLSDRPGPRVCVVVPTRELAVQVATESERLTRFMDVSTVAVYGGDSMGRQIKALERGAKVVAATPGRLLDHIGRRNIRLENLDVLVLDEADRMFDLGFRDDIAKIIRHAPGRDQTMLLSATISDEVMELAAQYMNDPAEIFLAPDKPTVEGVDQFAIPVEQNRKVSLLLHVVEEETPDRTIIFTRTKARADRLAKTLGDKGLEVGKLHGDLRQQKREQILRRFRDGSFPIMIATDVAARGIDISDVSHVINFDVPQNAEDYVHRIGRTGRMGKRGVAHTFVTPEDGEFLTAIEKLINQEVPVRTYADFEHPESGGPKTDSAEDLKKKIASQYVRTIHGLVRKRTRR